MMFSSKLAKLGKAEKINCSQVKTDPITFVVYLSNKTVSLKTLSFQNYIYSLGKAKQTFNYDEMIAIDQDYALARIGNHFSLIKVTYGA